MACFLAQTRRPWLVGLFALAASSCSVEGEDGMTTFGTTLPSTTMPSTTLGTGSGSSTTLGTGSGSATSDASSSSAATTDGGESSDTSGVSSTTGPSQQPDSGMYSDCLSVAECVGQTTCVTINDANMTPADGFCTTAPCVDPVTDCDPSPGGTAQPACVEITVGGNPAVGCALDCSAGKTCPNGMVCYTLPGSGEVCA